MSKRFLLLLSFAVGLLVFSPACMAKNADILLSPTRLIFENNSKFMTVYVRNNGDATGRYKIEVVDTKMSENGAIEILPEGTKDAHSAQDYISLSPRALTLKPDENQPVRILIKNMSALPDGEYRSHLQVRMTDNDLDSSANDSSPEGATIVIKPMITTVIPMIVRKGATDYKVSLDQAKLVPTTDGTGKEKQEVQLTFGLTGNRSALGDVKVTHIAQDGKETQLAFFQGIAIYRDVAKRTQNVALDIPTGVNIHSGKIEVTFVTQENEGRKLLATKVFTP